MKKHDVQELYDRIADKYQKNRSKADNDYIELPAMMDLLGSVKGKRVLDLGCGLGGHSKILIKNGAHVTAIDASQKMIKFAKLKCKNRGEFLVGNFEKVVFPKHSFDLVMASYSIHYIKNIRSLFKKISHWLKPNGKIVFSILHPIQYDLRIENFDFSKSGKYWLHLRAYDVDIFNWFHPLEEYVVALHTNGFEIIRVKEPCLDKKYTGFHPNQYRLPSCIIFEAKKI